MVAGVFIEQRLHDLRGVFVEPVHVFGHDERGAVAYAGEQIVVHRACDPPVQLGSVGISSLVPGLRRDGQHRRQQRGDLRWIEAAPSDFSFQKCDALGGRCRTRDPASPFE